MWFPNDRSRLIGGQCDGGVHPSWVTRLSASFIKLGLSQFVHLAKSSDTTSEGVEEDWADTISPACPIYWLKLWSSCSFWVADLGDLPFLDGLAIEIRSSSPGSRPRFKFRGGIGLLEAPPKLDTPKSDFRGTEFSAACIMKSKASSVWFRKASKSKFSILSKPSAVKSRLESPIYMTMSAWTL